mmetsp:Transcript_122433/g.353916  ORF Transcript_122433/g.353916 Transcript_122433/m.353916 type:complete len:437 (+) Transcript_122433:55-1365(+)
MLACRKIHIYPQKMRSFSDEVWWKVEEPSSVTNNANADEECQASAMITELEVSSVHISDRLAENLMEIFQRCTIRKAIFRMCEVRPKVLREILCKCDPPEALQHLTLHRVNKFDHECVRLVTSRLVGLKSLAIHYKSPAESSFSYLLDRIHKLRNLEAFMLDGSLINDDDVSALVSSLKTPDALQKLRILSFKGCILSDAAIARIVCPIADDESRLPNLTKLDLSINQCYEAGMEALGSVLRAPWCRLQHLDISCQLPRMECPLPVHLLCRALETNRSLLSLRLSGNAIRDVSLLGQTLALNKGLQSLDWCGNCLNLEGLELLSRSLAQNRTLRSLNIKSNRIATLDGLDLSPNDTLCNLGHSCRGPEVQHIDHICHLNTIGRRLIRESPASSAIWPLVLQKCKGNVDDLNYFIRNAQNMFGNEVGSIGLRTDHPV